MLFRSDRHLARALAVAMHVLFAVLIVVGVSWQKKPETPVMADLWSSLPVLPQHQPQPQAAPPEEEDEPTPPKPAPRVKPVPPPPKPVPKVEPKADIATKLEKKKAEPKAEPKKREEDKAAAERTAAEAREREQREQQKKAADAEREAAEKAAAEKAAAERAAKAAAQAAAQQELNRYRAGIVAKIRSRMVRFEGNMEAVFSVQLFPGGELQSVSMVRSSGNAEFDAAVRQAINQSQPYVVPAGELFQQFRQLTLSFRP